VFSASTDTWLSQVVELRVADPRTREPSRHEGGRNTTVLLCGESSRRPFVLDAVSRTGARPGPISTFSRVRPAPVVVLAWAEERPADVEADLDTVGRLRTCGATLIAYADGADAWPLARRCRVLLKGVSSLLDSASAQFADELQRALEHALLKHDQLSVADERLKAVMSPHGLVGESRASLDLFSSILKIGSLSDLPTLLTGESGTGKELVAHAIHAHDPKRCTAPFVALNCGAIPSTLAETELFGHRRGAFTGADRNRRGLFRAADGGVLFLDEVAELGLDVQAKLLRVLQDSHVLALGDDADSPVSVRVIAATNADLRDLVAKGRFRADLFFRLNVVSIHLTPLRDRRDDIRPLVAHFLGKHHALNASAAAAGCAGFIDALERLRLSGNARQLENLVRFALVHNDGTVPLGLQDLPPDVWEELAAETSGPLAATASAEPSLDLLEANGWNLSRALEACERSFMRAAFDRSDGNQSKTARLLGITPRCVYNKLRRHRLA
jgi:DNA-binding NtrC family response regulator